MINQAISEQTFGCKHIARTDAGYFSRNRYYDKYKID